VKDGLVDASWSQGAEKGDVTDSVVVFLVRKGNPKHIRTWDDLVKPGVQVLEPNPFTSGGAKWNVSAAYGAQIAQGKSPAQAQAYLKALFHNVAVQDKSARDALQTFSSGKGDVLLAYENEAITAQKKGVASEYVIPDQTILIENPVAAGSKSKHPAQARAFVDYLHTAPAQRIFADNGYRPVLKSELDAKRFPVPKDLFTIGKLGGWDKVNTEFFDPDKGIVAGIERGLGVNPAAK
jgi:sulfate transport system substrate-binding protein